MLTCKKRAREEEQTEESRGAHILEAYGKLGKKKNEESLETRN